MILAQAVCAAQSDWTLPTIIGLSLVIGVVIGVTL